VIPDDMLTLFAPVASPDATGAVFVPALVLASLLVGLPLAALAAAVRDAIRGG
jgi:hypothetical protein